MSRTIRVFVAAAVTLITLVIAPSAAAMYVAGSYGSAIQGPLELRNDVDAWHHRVATSASWSFWDFGCDESWRKLRLTVWIERSTLDGITGYPGWFKTFARKGVVRNCGEGLLLGKTATALGWACPSGAFRPGRYTVYVSSRHVATGLRAEGLLDFKVQGTC